MRPGLISFYACVGSIQLDTWIVRRRGHSNSIAHLSDTEYDRKSALGDAAATAHIRPDEAPSTGRGKWRRPSIAESVELSCSSQRLIFTGTVSRWASLPGAENPMRGAGERSAHPTDSGIAALAQLFPAIVRGVEARSDGEDALVVAAEHDGDVGELPHPVLDRGHRSTKPSIRSPMRMHLAAQAHRHCYSPLER